MKSMKYSCKKTAWLAAIFGIACCLKISSTSAASIPVQSLHKDADGVALTMSPGKMKLTVCSDGIVRVMYSPTATLPTGQDFVVTNHSWASTSFKVAEANGKVTVTTRKLKVAVDKTSGAVAFYDVAGKLLLAESAGGGKTVTANAPVRIPPLYVHAGSIVPLGPVVQYATEKPADPIELRIYRGADGAFTLYEDEGDNYNYEKGKHATIPLEWNEARQTLTIGKRPGDFPGILKERAFRVVYVSPGHGSGMAAEEAADSIVRYTGKAVTVSRKK